MRNLNLFVGSIILRISDAMGNKTLFAIYLRGGTRMNSGENNSSPHHKVNQAAANKPIFHPGWQSSQNKPWVLMRSLPIFPALFVLGKCYNPARKHMRRNLRVMMIMLTIHNTLQCCWSLLVLIRTAGKDTPKWKYTIMKPTVKPLVLFKYNLIWMFLWWFKSVVSHTQQPLIEDQPTDLSDVWLFWFCFCYCGQTTDQTSS